MKYCVKGTHGWTGKNQRMTILVLRQSAVERRRFVPVRKGRIAMCDKMQ